MDLTLRPRKAFRILKILRSHYIIQLNQMVEATTAVKGGDAVAVDSIGNEQDKEKINGMIDRMRLLDDLLMTMVFDGNIPATQRMINIILGREDIIVKSVTVQKLEKSPLADGYDARLDIFAEDSDGNHYNFEVQRANAGAGKERARFLSAALDQRMLKHREKFKDIRDSYVIFITENDVFGHGLPLYHISRRFEEYDEWFDDGNHIIYANAAYSDESTDIGKLMHDFREQDPDKMYFPELRDGVSHFKKAEKGRDRMGGEVEEYAEEYSKKRSENAAINSAIKTCRDLNPEMTDSQIKEYIMRSFGLSEETAGKYFTPQPA